MSELHRSSGWHVILASGSPNGVSSDVWCGMLGWDAVTLSIGRPERWLLPKRWDLVGVFWTSSAGRAENYLSWAGAGDVLGGGAESCCGLGLPGHGSMTLWWCVTRRTTCTVFALRL